MSVVSAPRSLILEHGPDNPPAPWIGGGGC